MSTGQDVRVWVPPVSGITEVLHARFTDHAYPMHTHGSWTLLVVDDGVVRYDLDRHEHGAFRQVVTLLPPGVAHNGCPATPVGWIWPGGCWRRGRRPERWPWWPASTTPTVSPLDAAGPGVATGR